jgi:hypothetical protein
MIAGALPIMRGELHRDRKMKVGWFHQHQIEAMDPSDTPLEIIRRRIQASIPISDSARIGRGMLACSRRCAVAMELNSKWSRRSWMGTCGTPVH